MPQRCSVPGCKVRYKQGYKLMCYPKDLSRRAAWLQSLRNRGLEPTNMHFVCELHFGPSQWEKVRVDGTRKLKWQGVPDTFDLKSSPSAACSTDGGLPNQALKRASNSPNVKTVPIILGKVPKLDGKQFSTEHQQLVTKNLVKGMVNSAICNVENISSTHMRFSIEPESVQSHVENSDGDKVPKLDGKQFSTEHQQLVTKNLVKGMVNSAICNVENISSTHMRSPIELESVQSHVKNSDGVDQPVSNPPATCQITLPLQEDDHCIVIKVPPSRHQSSLMEDLDDVKTFLNMKELQYEERLVKSISELVEKHKKVDKKLKRADEAVIENRSLKAKLKILEEAASENFGMKVQLQRMKFLEAQNTVMMEKIRSYEERIKILQNVVNIKIEPSEDLVEGVSNTAGMSCNDSASMRQVSSSVAFLDTNQYMNEK